MKRSAEAFWWSLFSAGGVVSALFLPAFVFVTGLVLPSQHAGSGNSAYERIYDIVSWWPVRAVLFVVLLLSFVHAAHRLKHIVMDLGWRRVTAPLSILCYGGAIAGAAAGGYLLYTL